MKKMHYTAKARDISRKKVVREYEIQSDSREGLLEMLYKHEKSLCFPEKPEFLSESLQEEYLRYSGERNAISEQIFFKLYAAYADMSIEEKQKMLTVCMKTFPEHFKE